MKHQISLILNETGTLKCYYKNIFRENDLDTLYPPSGCLTRLFGSRSSPNDGGYELITSPSISYIAKWIGLFFAENFMFWQLWR